MPSPSQSASSAGYTPPSSPLSAPSAVGWYSIYSPARISASASCCIQTPGKEPASVLPPSGKADGKHSASSFSSLAYPLLSSPLLLFPIHLLSASYPRQFPYSSLRQSLRSIGSPLLFPQVSPLFLHCLPLYLSAFSYLFLRVPPCPQQQFFSHSLFGSCFPVPGNFSGRPHSFYCPAHRCPIPAAPAACPDIFPQTVRHPLPV